MVQIVCIYLYIIQSCLQHLETLCIIYSYLYILYYIKINITYLYKIRDTNYVIYTSMIYLIKYLILYKICCMIGVKTYCCKVCLLGIRF
jgi:hypothetical protein